MAIAAEYDVNLEAATDASCAGGIRPEDLRRVVSIHYYGRSGSLFLQSLLDGHPQVVMLPGTYLAGFYRFWEMFGQLPALKLLGAFITNYDVLFDARSPVPVFEVGRNVGTTLGFDRMGENQDRALGVDRDEFMEIMLAHVIRVCDDPNVDRLPRRFFLQAIHAAYAQALGRPMFGKEPLIVLQTHNPYFEEVEPLYQDFGVDVKFLHCLREPIQALGSWYSHWWETCIGPDPRGAPPQLELAGASIARGVYAWKIFTANRRRRWKKSVPGSVSSGTTRCCTAPSMASPGTTGPRAGRRSRVFSRPQSPGNTPASSRRSTAFGSNCCSRISSKPGIIPFPVS